MRLLCAALVSLLAAVVPRPAALQDGAPPAPAAFRFERARVPVGRVLHYEKSNLDGSHATRIAVYVAALDRLESFKWAAGFPGATLVEADIAWRTFTVRRFQSWRLEGPGQRTLQGTLEAVEEKPELAFALAAEDPAAAVSGRVTIHHWPWHSYDFDFAGLGIAMPHLIEPERPFDVGIADFVVEGGKPVFVEKGAVTVAFEERETRDGIAARRYAIDGPGLEDRGGHLWTDAQDGHLLGFEIELPDEPGFESGKLRLLEVGSLSPEDWTAFQDERLQGR